MELKTECRLIEFEVDLRGGPFDGTRHRYVGFACEIVLPYPLKPNTLCIYQNVDDTWWYVGMKMSKAPQIVTHRDLLRMPPRNLVDLLLWLRRRPRIVVGRPHGKSLHAFRGVRRGCIRFNNNLDIPMSLMRAPYKVDWDQSGFWLLFPNGNVIYRVDYL